jgi:hypothetical protein
MTLQEFQDKVSTGFKFIHDEYFENATAFFNSNKEKVNDIEFKIQFDEIKYIAKLKSTQTLKILLEDLDSVIFDDPEFNNGQNDFDSGYNYLIEYIFQSNLDMKNKKIEILGKKN